MNEFSSSEKELIIHHIKKKIEQGYVHIADNQLIEACDKWWEAWLDVKRWLIPHYQTTSIESFSDQISDDFLMYDWIQIFEDELEKAGNTNNRFYELRYILAFDFRKNFPHSDEMILMKMGTAAAQALFYLGRIEESERLFKKLLVGDYTEGARGWIYIHWGDIYTNSDNKDIAEIKKAKALYYKALELLDKKDHEFALMRINELKAN